MRNPSVGLLLCGLAMPAQAQWSGEVAVGYLATAGNTSTKSLNGKVGIDYTTAAWKNGFQGLGVYSADAQGATAERYGLSDKLDWNLSEQDYAFAAIDWEKDLFAGIRERLSETIGYGRHVLTGPQHLLDLEVGAGARQSKENLTGERSNDFIVRGLGKYGYTLSQTSQFLQVLKVESGESNTYGESVSELKLSIVGNLFAGLSYTVKHNTTVPAGTKKTDTYTAVSLSYAFGQS
ncbi:DUF481 domain-containing protein [Fontimonas sp. SYSU GA230001]|uniref:DUF481 domain-containing protein n=1 Tax=Fontimonas sp. SYSU GA230001 TaxID=3142450 RepID=UPI0032B39705